MFLVENDLLFILFLSNSQLEGILDFPEHMQMFSGTPPPVFVSGVQSVHKLQAD